MIRRFIYMYVYIFRCNINASKFYKIPQYQPQYFFAWGLNLDFIKSREKVFSNRIVLGNNAVLEKV